jgi:hypothetical protein
MERTIFKDSAFKHGYNEDDYDALMRAAKLVLRSRRGYQNVYEILGRNTGGDYLHIVTRRYLKGADRIAIVFHMSRMKPSDRKRFIQHTGKS